VSVPRFHAVGLRLQNRHVSRLQALPASVPLFPLFFSWRETLLIFPGSPRFGVPLRCPAELYARIDTCSSGACFLLLSFGLPTSRRDGLFLPLLFLELGFSWPRPSPVDRSVYYYPLLPNFGVVTFQLGDWCWFSFFLSLFLPPFFFFFLSLRVSFFFCSEARNCRTMAAC